MVGTIIFVVFLIFTVVGTYAQIPDEDPEIIKAREEWGTAK